MSGGRTLRVWAPDAGSVVAIVDRTHVELRRCCERGWWESAESFRPGSNYRFSIDGGPERPDPRAEWQPEGISGPSRVVDHAAFQWTDQEWRPPALADGLVYEAHVGTFSGEGTFQGVAGHLDDLVELGVTHLQLMPIAEFSGHWGWGYDGADLYAPHSAYGSPDDLKGLVDSAHARGLAMLVDVVYNHLGPAGNHLSEFGPYFTDRHSTPWGSAVNFDGEHSDEVRRFFIDNALMWLRDYHFDGLRIDAVHAIFDMSATHFLEQLTAEVRDLEGQLGRTFTLIAESDLNDPRLIRSVEHGGYGLDAQWNDDFHHALHSVLADERSGYYEDFGNLADLAKSLEQGYRYAGDYSQFRRRSHGRVRPDLDGRRLVGFLQNHDQIGNRALGERSAALMSRGRLMIGAAVVILGPFVPLLFQGEEWAASSPFRYFTSHRDPELGRAVSEGRRNEFAAFGWDPASVPDPQDHETFEASRLDWAERSQPDHEAILDWHRQLIGVRRDFAELRDGRLGGVSVEFEEAHGWLVMDRGRVSLVFNVGAHPQRFERPADEQLLLRSNDDVLFDPGHLLLPRDSVAILARP